MVVGRNLEVLRELPGASGNGIAPFPFVRQRRILRGFFGEMAEWSKALPC